MKFKLVTLLFALGSLFFVSTSSMRDPNNPPTGKTGAPGETTCVQSGCHSGGAFTGTVTISGVPDTALFGHVYPITLKNTSNAVRAGFQLTCLDSINVKCGTLTSASGVSIGNGNSRQYARQSQPKNLSGGSTSWTFNWTAPNSSSGNKASFYFVSLCCNSNGSNSGDNVLISNKKVVLTALSATHEPDAATLVKLYPSQVTDVLNVDLLAAQEGQLYIFNAEGRLTLQKDLIELNIVDVASLNAGTYFAKIQTKAGAVVKKFVKY